MKKQIILLTTILFTGLTVKAQVGVGTENPQASFHVDGAADNPQTGTPDASAQANDVVITETGRIGIGTLTPGTKLEINNGTTNGAIKIVDGTQGENRVLVSDADGVGTWQESTAVKSAILATFPNTGANRRWDAVQYTGTYITLPPGKWSVQASLLLSNGAWTDPNTVGWFRAYWSNSSVVSTITPDIIGNRIYAGIISGPSMYGMMNGTIILNNTSGGNKTYYLWKGNADILNADGSWTLHNFARGIAGEDMIVAYPMND